MSKLVLKQEIPGKYIPTMVSMFLSSDSNSTEGHKTDGMAKLEEIKRVFRDRLNDGMSLSFSMYIDKQTISTFDDFTIIIELFEEDNNGLKS